MVTVLKIVPTDKVGESIVASFGDIVCLEEIKSNGPSGFPSFKISANGSEIWVEEKHPHFSMKLLGEKNVVRNSAQSL